MVLYSMLCFFLGHPHNQQHSLWLWYHIMWYHVSYSLPWRLLWSHSWPQGPLVNHIWILSTVGLRSITSRSRTRISLRAMVKAHIGTPLLMVWAGNMKLMPRPTCGMWDHSTLAPVCTGAKGASERNSKNGHRKVLFHKGPLLLFLPWHRIG